MLLLQWQESRHLLWLIGWPEWSDGRHVDDAGWMGKRKTIFNCCRNSPSGDRKDLESEADLRKSLVLKTWGSHTQVLYLTTTSGDLSSLSLRMSSREDAEGRMSDDDLDRKTFLMFSKWIRCLRKVSWAEQRTQQWKSLNFQFLLTFTALTAAGDVLIIHTEKAAELISFWRIHEMNKIFLHSSYLLFLAGSFCCSFSVVWSSLARPVAIRRNCFTKLTNLLRARAGEGWQNVS